MVITSIGKHFLIFTLLFATLTINIDDGIISRLGFEFGYGYVAIASLVVCLLLVGQTTAIAAVVIGLSLVANMPGEFVLNFGVDRDLYFGFAAAIIFAPLADRVFE